MSIKIVQRGGSHATAFHRDYWFSIFTRTIYLSLDAPQL